MQIFDFPEATFLQFQEKFKNSFYASLLALQNVFFGWTMSNDSILQKIPTIKWVITVLAEEMFGQKSGQDQWVFGWHYQGLWKNKGQFL